MRKFLSLIAASLLVAAVMGCSNSPTSGGNPLVTPTPNGCVVGSPVTPVTNPGLGVAIDPDCPMYNIGQEVTLLVTQRGLANQRAEIYLWWQDGATQGAYHFGGAITASDANPVRVKFTMSSNHPGKDHWVQVLIMSGDSVVAEATTKKFTVK